MSTGPEERGRRLSEQDYTDVCDCVRIGGDWEAVQRYANRPMHEVKSFVRRQWPRQAAILDRRSGEAGQT
jgi:hypothetical protein